MVLFVVTSFTFIQLDNRKALDPVKTGLHDLIVPAADVFNRVGNRSADPSDLQRQVDQLKAQVGKLEADNAQLKVKADEVDTLRQQLNVQERNPTLTYVSARVIGRDPTGLQKIITIDKGSADKIEKGMAVVDPNIFVGQVTEVAEHSAKVTLAIDASYSVGAQLSDTGAIGVAYGMWQRQGRMELRHVDRGVVPKPAELVVTADPGNASTAKVPRGLVIGKVYGNPVTDNQGDTETIQILPVADFDKLTVVAVIVAAKVDKTGG